MAVNTYEMLFLLDPNKFSSDPEAVTQNVNSVLTSQGGEVVFSRPWNESKLAYPIKNGIPIMLADEARELSDEELR